MSSPLTRALALVRGVGPRLPGTRRRLPRPGLAMDEPLPVSRLRCALAIAAANGASEDRHLRSVVRDFVLAERARGALVEQIIVALKHHASEAIVVPRGDPFRDVTVGRVVAWCIDDYFHCQR